MLALTEAEIMACWPVDEPVRVSVCCITYKQEQYIAQAIDGFLMQKTIFPFEVIIGEDCGGDCTLHIIESYQEKYPNIIKIIRSEKNVGANANLLRVFYSAKGEYISICEGDDYWIDENKIQKQVVLLDENAKVDICFTAAKTLDPDGCFGVLAKYKNNISTFTISDVVRGGGGFMPTASLMFRRSVVNRIPDWFSIAPIGDYYIQIIGSINGGAIYIPDLSVVYRRNSVGSWSEAKKNKSEDKILSTLNCLLNYASKLPSCGLCNEDVCYIKAAHGTDASVELLLGGYFDNIKNVILSSWASKRFIGKMQLFIYVFRFFPRVSSFLLKYKHY